MENSNLRVAVIGSGVAGLGASWLLSLRHRVSLYEKASYFGGHANTVTVGAPEGQVPIDTGFIVYNTACYDNLVAWFERLGVETAETNMSFAVSLKDGEIEYSSNGLTGLVGTMQNALRPGHWRMLRDALLFFGDAQRDLHDATLKSVPLGEYLERRGYGRGFVDHHILPMACAIWSTPEEHVLDFPTTAFLRFFANHGLLRAFARPKWRTVSGGSRSYVKKALEGLAGEAFAARGVRRILRQPSGVIVEDDTGKREHYDHVVLATHADQALGLLGDADDEERDVLGSFRYASNNAVLHTDATLMPQRRRLWASWNYLSGRGHQAGALSDSYWMNKLQPLATRQDYFVTLNPWRDITPGRVVQSFHYDHPMFDERAIAAQSRIWPLQGRRRTWFCGSYAGYGFHEDALQSGLEVAERLGGVERPWRLASPSDRLSLDLTRIEAGRLEAAQ
jgi:predicted NAD/FAD-binding protein